MTMEIVAEFLGIDTDKGAWEYFTHRNRDWPIDRTFSY